MVENSDHLKFLMSLLKMNLWKSITFRIVTILISVIIECSSVACIVINRNNYHQYISLILISQPGIVSTITAMFFSNIVDQSLKPSTENFWPIDIASEKLKSSILQSTRIINKLIALIIFIFIGGYLVTYLPLVGDEADINAMEMVSTHYFGRWSILFSIVIYLYYPIFAFGLIYPFILVTYLTILASTQLKLLREEIRMLADESMYFQGNHLLYNENYQDEVYQKMILCIEHHIRLIRFRNTWVKHSRFVMLYIPFASLAPVGSTYFLIHQISPSSNFRMVLTLVMFATTVTVLCFVGQHFQDSFAEIFTVACECPWIYWDKRNKQALLLLLLYSAKPMEISSYTTIAVNFRLLKMFHTWIYSLITLMLDTSAINKQWQRNNRNEVERQEVNIARSIAEKTDIQESSE